jgi:hypothetical protein
LEEKSRDARWTRMQRRADPKQIGQWKMDGSMDERVSGEGDVAGLYEKERWEGGEKVG